MSDNIVQPQGAVVPTRTLRLGAWRMSATAATIFLVIVALIPIWLVRVVPLSDWVNHLARMQVIAAGKHDPWLSAFYRIDWQLIPNLAMDVLVPPLAKVMGVYAAGKVFMSLTVVMMLTGPFAVQRAIYGRNDAWPLVAFLFVYNDIFLVGLANYLFGVGLSLWGLAAWIWLRERNLVLRMVVSFLFVFALYVCHLYAAGLYGVALFGYELRRWTERRFVLDRRLVVEILTIGIPFLPLLPLLLGSATWGLVHDFEWDLRGKLDALRMAVSGYTDLLDLVTLSLLGVAFFWGWRQGLIRFQATAGVFLVVAGAVFIAMPSMLFGSYMADQRMPIAILLMLVGFGRLAIHERAVRIGFLVLVTSFASLRIADVGVHWWRLSSVYDEFRASMATVEPGAKILVAHADEPQGWEDFQEAISHAACLAMIERSALVSTAFTVKGKQIMTVRSEFHDRVDTEDGDPPTMSRLLAATIPTGTDKGNFWDNWQQKHDYIYLLYTARGAENPDPAKLDLVHEGMGFQLYRIKHGAAAASIRMPGPITAPGATAPAKLPAAASAAPLKAPAQKAG